MRRLLLFLTLFLASAISGSAANHRYWRVYIDLTQGGWTACAELEFHATVGGANIATGGTAAASHVDGAHTADQCFDGNTSTYWQVNGSTYPLPSWISYDLGSGNDNTVAEIKWTGRSDTSDENPIAFQMQYSDNNSTWTTAWNGQFTEPWTNGEAATLAALISTIYVDSATSKTAGTSSNYTFTQTISSNMHGLWCVFVGFVDTNSLAAVSSIADTTDSSNFTFIRKDGAYVNSDSLECWCMLGSSYSAGAKTVTVTLSPAPAQESIVGSIALTGVKQSLTPDAAATAYSTGGGGFAQPNTAIVTVTDKDAVIDGFIDNTSESNPLPTAPGMRFYNQASDRGGFGSFKIPVTPAGTTYMAWTGLTQSWRQTLLAWAPFVSYAPKHKSITF